MSLREANLWFLAFFKRSVNQYFPFFLVPLESMENDVPYHDNRIRIGPEQMENIASLTFKKAKNHEFASRKLISQYVFGHKMG